MLLCVEFCAVLVLYLCVPVSAAELQTNIEALNNPHPHPHPSLTVAVPLRSREPPHGPFFSQPRTMWYVRFPSVDLTRDCVLVSGGQRHHLERSPLVHGGSPGRRFGGRARVQGGVGRTEGLWRRPGAESGRHAAFPPSVYVDWSD